MRHKLGPLFAVALAFVAAPAVAVAQTPADEVGGHHAGNGEDGRNGRTTIVKGRNGKDGKSVRGKNGGNVHGRNGRNAHGGKGGKNHGKNGGGGPGPG